MRILFVLLCGLTTITAQADIAAAQANDASKEQAVAAARKEFVDAAFKHSDPDGDDKVTLVEQTKLQDAFYEAMKQAGGNETAVAEVREAHKGLLKLQWFLAADLNDDEVVTRDELTSLAELSETEHLAYNVDRIWTLSDADIDQLMDDFKLRIRRGVRCFPEDALRKTRGEGRTKTEKLEDQSSVFRSTVIDNVLTVRMQYSTAREFDKDKCLAALRKLKKWEFDVSSTTREKTNTRRRGVEIQWDSEDEYAWFDLEINGRFTSGVGYHAVNFKRETKPLKPREYKFESTASDEAVVVPAGTINARLISVSIGNWQYSLWAHKDFPMVHAKYETKLPGKTTVSRLLSLTLKE